MHADTAKFVKSVTRFRALEPDGLFALAKDLMRIVADRIDVSNLQKIASPPKSDEMGFVEISGEISRYNNFTRGCTNRDGATCRRLRYARQTRIQRG